MIAILGIIILIWAFAKAAIEDADMRNYSRSKGHDVYASSRGVRNVSNNKPGFRTDRW